MIKDVDASSMEYVAGGDEYTRQWGEWVGAAISEMNEHPVGALFGIGGVVVAHYLSEH